MRERSKWVRVLRLVARVVIKPSGQWRRLRERSKCCRLERVGRVEERDSGGRTRQ